MSMKSMNEYSIWYQLWAPLAMYMNPIFSINVGKISQDCWFYFTKQVSFWMRDDSLWANGAEVWFYISGSFCSLNLLFPCARSLWSTVACRWIASRHQRCGQALQNHGKGDSRQISPIQNVNSLLSAAGAAPSIFFEKILQSVWLGYEF